MLHQVGGRQKLLQRAQDSEGAEERLFRRVGERHPVDLVAEGASHGLPVVVEIERRRLTAEPRQLSERVEHDWLPGDPLFVSSSTGVDSRGIIGALNYLGSMGVNALYFLPILYTSWFEAPPADWPQERVYPRAETSLMLLLPTLFTAAAAFAVGLFASAPYSPLEWARLITERQFSP